MTSYSLTIQNNSGADQNVAVFQVDDPASGWSLVWLAQTINNGNNYPFNWETNWGLSWGRTSQRLDTGVIYKSGQTVTEVQPNQVNGVTVLPITYKNQDFDSEKAYYDCELNLGVVHITTDTSFTVQESLNMSVAMYMDNKPILAAQGKPNTTYEFNTNVSYYLAVTDYQEGAAIPNRLLPKLAMSQPTKVQFPNGVTHVEYNLSDTLVFCPVSEKKNLISK